jgi:CRP-like cAMP-binding protein
MRNFKLVDLNHLQKIELLETFDLVDNLASNQIGTLATFLRAYLVTTNDPILTEGEKNNFFCLICDGEVDIIKSDLANNTKKLSSLGPGKIIGEISFFDQGPCSAGVVAKNEVTLLVIDRTEFNSLCEQATHIALEITLKIMRSLGQRLRQTTGKLIDLL